MTWEFYEPTFEYRARFDDLDFPWTGHCRFGYDLCANLKPRRVVELGTFKGTSVFSFAQAVKDLSLVTEIHAVDTWQGDAHNGLYGEEVYESVCTLRQAYYANIELHFHRMRFDEALSRFQDQSIDLLHIDGLHTYEAARHDFETWLPKCKKDAVVLFHDICEKKWDFGVHRLWDELKKQCRTAEFIHAHGLGVLFLNPESYDRIDFDQRRVAVHYPVLAYEEVKERLSKANEQLTNIRTSRSYRAYTKMRRLMKSLKVQHVRSKQGPAIDA